MGTGDRPAGAPSDISRGGAIGDAYRPRSVEELRAIVAQAERIRVLGTRHSFNRIGESDALVQAHERMSCCDIFRAGDGVHATFVEQRMRGLGVLARTALALHPFHRSVIALEREMFTSPRLKAVIANSNMVAEDISKRF